MLNASKIVGFKKSSIVYKLRDQSQPMVKAWEDSFDDYPNIECSQGDIFKGAPAADAIVAPANSFGFMDGGIEMYYSMHFGWQMQDRLQAVIQKEKHGELLVGDAVIIPAYKDEEDKQKLLAPEFAIMNEGQPIKFLISAPTARVPQDVSQTINAYLAFRAVILAVKRHNAEGKEEPIRSVLCPGLGTAVGRMPKTMCAKQMLMAYETFELGQHRERVHPQKLQQMYCDQQDMIDVPDC